MRTMLLALLAALGGGADEPTTTVVLEIDNVCGPDCIAILETALGKIDGVREAKMYGDKFHFRLVVLENKPFLPSSVVKVLDQIKQDSKGETEFPLREFTATLAGTVEKQGDAVTFVARGTGQKYSVKPHPALTELMAAGRSKVTLTGIVAEEKDPKKPPSLEVSEATEAVK